MKCQMGFLPYTVNCKFALVRVESLVCPPKEIKFVSLIKLVKQNPNFHVLVYTKRDLSLFLMKQLINQLIKFFQNGSPAGNNSRKTRGDLLLLYVHTSPCPSEEVLVKVPLCEGLIVNDNLLII